MKTKTCWWITDARNYWLEITCLRTIILHNADLVTLAISLCLTSAPVCLTEKYLGKGFPNKLRVESTTHATFSGFPITPAVFVI